MPKLDKDSRKEESCAQIMFFMSAGAKPSANVSK
jgi:hypothetical protein